MSNINLDTWKMTLEEFYPKRDYNVIPLPTSKNNKSPGNDEICNEFWKNLTPNWEHNILIMFLKRYLMRYLI